VRHSSKTSGVDRSRGRSQLVKGLIGEQRNEDIGAGRQQRCGFGQMMLEISVVLSDMMKRLDG